MSPTATTRFYGWTVVAAAFVIAVFGWGLGFYGPPIYLKAVQDRTGWPVALVSAAVTAHFLVGAVVVANLPALHRRLGLPAVTIGCAASLALGLLGWSLASAPWQLFVATAFSGAGWVGLGAAAINAMVSPWFVRRRPVALAMAYNGASIGGVVFSPLWVLLIGSAGFVAATAIVGLVMLTTVSFLAATVLRHSPASRGVEPDGDDAGGRAQAAIPSRAPVGNPWRDRGFLTLAIAMAVSLFAQIGLITHLFSLLAPAIGPRAAGLLAGLSTAMAIVGRTSVGLLMPVGTNRRVIAAVNLGVQMAGCCAFLLAGGTAIWLLVVGTLLIGFGIGNATSLPPLIAQAEFAREDVPRIVALITATSQATYAFAPAAFGLIRDLSATPASGSAAALFIVAAASQAAAALAYLAGRGRA